MNVTRTQTSTGTLVRFDSRALPKTAEGQTGEGSINLGHSARGAHVERLVAALNQWWDECRPRPVKPSLDKEPK